MSLRTQAAADFKAIAENTDEFGWPVTVTNPNGLQAALTGLSSDVHASIDPDTGQLVSGRSVSVVLRVSSLEDAGLGMPRGVSSPGALPWRVTFDDIDGSSHTFKVAEALPDRTIGSVVCMLEHYSHT